MKTTGNQNKFPTELPEVPSRLTDIILPLYRRVLVGLKVDSRKENILITDEVSGLVAGSILQIALATAVAVLDDSGRIMDDPEVKAWIKETSKTWKIPTA